MRSRAADPARSLTLPGIPGVVLGGAGYAGLFRPVGEAPARATLNTAWQKGIRAFDTAPHYGAGLGEERLRPFLRGRERADYWVCTKVGRLLRDDPLAVDGTDGFYGTPKRSRRRDYSAMGVRRSLADSLARLGLDHVDMLLVHDPEDHLEQALRSAVPEMVRMREQGLTAGIGVGVNTVETALRFVREAPIDCVLIAGRYTLLDRRAEAELLPECARRGISVLAGGVLNSGILADPLSRTTFDYHAAESQVLARAHAMAAVCADYGIPLRAAALQFPRRHSAVTATVLGAGTAAEIADSLDMLNTTVPDQLWHDLGCA
ncbi:aldo/keto reductase [Nocardia concava]|uniref:aldo/keto reductase n=1 Tax=Nocardia concava TaxID=257281 RepID=UPI0002E90AD0|nr:aldo/keto reductase [Nocardia concava]